MTPEKILLNKKDAAQILSLSVRSIDYLIARKELTARRVGKRVLIPRQSLEQFARRDHLNVRSEGSAALSIPEEVVE